MLQVVLQCAQELLNKGCVLFSIAFFKELNGNSWYKPEVMFHMQKTLITTKIYLTQNLQNVI